MLKEEIDYTITYNVLKVFNIVIKNDLLDIHYNYKLLYSLIQVNSKFYHEYQPYLSLIEERIQETLTKMRIWYVKESHFIHISNNS